MFEISEVLSNADNELNHNFLRTQIHVIIHILL